MQFSNESLPAQKAIADFLNTIRPAHVKVTTPGYNYAYQNYGNPAGWDGNSQDLLRRDLETRTQATNGHSYNDSYRQSFAETLDTYKDQFPNGYTNGLPKEFVNSEFGTSDGMNSAFDDSGLAEVHAQTFDRILRAHLAFGSKFSVYGAGDDNGSFQLFDGTSPAAWTAHTNSNGSGETLRLKIFRQYALAYATHGKPLPFSFLNESAVTNKLAYVRAVDTSTLAPLPGSGGTSNKILVNFVNFDKVAQAISVRVTMPQNGTYSGERFGPEDTYTAARSTVSFVANPTIDLTVNLGPRESVQYILAPSVTLRTPENPAGAVNGVDYKYYEGTWSQRPAFAALTPIKSGTLANFSLTSANRADNFGFSYTGYVEVPTDGTYTFTTNSDDGSKLFIGTTEIVNNDGLHGAVEKSGTLGLKAGKHAFKVVFFESTGGEVLQVNYAGPGISKQPIPNSKLWRANPGSGNGTGLKGQYFNGTNFNTIVQTRTDAKIDFNWPGAPMSSVNEDDFSARWTGKVEPRYSQAYTFLTSNDDGVRLWVDGQLLIDKWISGVNNWSAATPVLNANQLYDIKMEYYEGGGGANAKLEWQSAPQSREVVPQSQLYPMDTLTNGLVGWWKLDENSGTVAADSSGSSRNGTATGVTWNPSSGKIGGSAQFSGSAARIILPDETLRGIGTTQSVACWFKSSSTGVIVGVQSTEYPTNPSSWNPVLWIGTDGKLRGQIWMGNNNLAVASPGVVNNGVWHHVALVALGNNQIVYLDGTAIGSVAANLGWSGKNQFGVGYTASWPSGNGSWMSYAGSFDDVRQYNRALTASEVAALATG